MTFAELQAAGFVEHHRCGACGEPVGYRIHPAYACAVFDPRCGCGVPSDYRALTHEELAAIRAK